MFTGVDGNLVIAKAGAAQSLNGFNWGSDIASIRNSCGGWNVLATAPSDYSRPDALRPFEWNDASVASAGDALEFNGPVTALWTAGDALSATAVSRNLRSGRYEAYSVLASCLQ
jgi:hypothetical protein